MSFFQLALFASSAAAAAAAAAGVHANLLPRITVAPGPIRTLLVPIPTGGAPFTSTIPGCDSTIAPFVIQGTPTGTFSEGSFTIYLPPQAQATTRTYFSGNASEVLVYSTLAGTCAGYPFPDPEPTPTGTETEAPTATPAVCPEGGCSGEVVRAAKVVIDVINKVSLLSANLQLVAARIGESAVGEVEGDSGVALAPIPEVVRGLQSITTTLTIAVPRIQFLPPFAAGCSTDTIVIALLEFVKIHQQLLNILIGRSGLLQGLPIKRDTTELAQRETSGLIGAPIAAGLRAVEGIVDTLAIKLISLIPTRSQCAANAKADLDSSLDEAILSYGG